MDTKNLLLPKGYSLTGSCVDGAMHGLLSYFRKPVIPISGFICYNQGIETELKAQVQARGLELKVHAISGLYF